MLDVKQRTDQLCLPKHFPTTPRVTLWTLLLQRTAIPLVSILAMLFDPLVYKAAALAEML